MVSMTYFLQNCPVCGRPSQVRVTYLGKRVTCAHCRGEFVARDPDAAPDHASRETDLMLRAARLLQRASRLPDQQPSINASTWIGL